MFSRVSQAWWSPGASSASSCGWQKALDGKGLDRRGGAAFGDQLGHDIAHAGAELEAGAGKAERVEQAGAARTGANHGLVVGQVAFGAAPGADDVGAGE